MNTMEEFQLSSCNNLLAYGHMVVQLDPKVKLPLSGGLAGSHLRYRMIWGEFTQLHHLGFWVTQAGIAGCTRTSAQP